MPIQNQTSTKNNKNWNEPGVKVSLGTYQITLANRVEEVMKEGRLPPDLPRTHIYKIYKIDETIKQYTQYIKYKNPKTTKFTTIIDIIKYELWNLFIIQNKILSF